MRSKKTDSVKSVKTPKKLPKELFELEATVGQFMEYWGFKKIHGRIWTHLFLSQNPLETGELMERLQVSKGLMSLAIRDLLEYEVILSDSVGRHGTVFYKANPDVLKVISNVLKARESKMLAQARQASEGLKKLGSEKMESLGLSAERAKNILELTSSAQLILHSFLIQDHEGPYSLLFDPPT